MDERLIASAAERWAREHRNELVDDLKRLILIPSVAEYDSNAYPMGTECARAADCLLDLGRKYGMDTQNDAYYSVRLMLPGTERRTALGMLGHLDVVPAGKGWRHDPFDPYLEKGFVFGRGSLDNKGPVTMALYTMRCMKEMGIRLRSDVVLIAGCDEEKEMRDIAHYLSTCAAPDFTLVCDGAWPMCIGEKGILNVELSQSVSSGNLLRLESGGASNLIPDHAEAILKNPDPAVLDELQKVFPDVLITSNKEAVSIRLNGKSAHCSTPENGENALLRLMQILSSDHLLKEKAEKQISALRKCFIDHHGTGLHIYHADSVSCATTCAPTGMSFRDGVLRTQVSVRYAVTQNPSLLLKRLEERCTQLGIGMRVLSHGEPRRTDPNDPIVRLLLDNCKKHLSRKCRPYVTGGGTYARYFPRSIPYGPAYLDAGLAKRYGQPHSANECVSVEQLLEGIKVYALALAKLDAYFTQTGKDVRLVVPLQKT